MEFDQGKGYCMYLHDVLCSFRLSSKLFWMGRCRTCVHYEMFVREMEEEEEEFFEEVERLRGAECCCVCGCKLGSDNRSDVWNVCVGCKKTLEM